MLHIIRSLHIHRYIVVVVVVVTSLMKDNVMSELMQSRVKSIFIDM